MQTAFRIFRAFALIANAVVLVGALILALAALAPNDVPTVHIVFGALLAAVFCAFNIYVLGRRVERAYPWVILGNLACLAASLLYGLAEFLAAPNAPSAVSCAGCSVSLPALACMFFHRYSRRPFQFSLRRLVLVTTGIGAAATAFTVLIVNPRLQRRASQQAAVDHLRKIVNGPYPDNCYGYDDWWVTSVHLKAQKVSDQDLEVIAKGLPKLVSLSLEDTQLTDEGMKHLAGLKELRALYLGGTKIGDDGLKHIADKTKLTYLTLYDTQITDDGLKHLSKMDKLGQLYLGGCAISDKGLAHLESLHSLYYLGLTDSNTTRDGLRKVSRAIPSASIYNGKTYIDRGKEVVK